MPQDKLQSLLLGREFADVPQPTPEQQQMADALAAANFRKLSPGRRYTAGILEGVAGAAGFNDGSAENYGKFAGNLLSAAALEKLRKFAFTALPDSVYDLAGKWPVHAMSSMGSGLHYGLSEIDRVMDERAATAMMPKEKK
jgi:hypothetical protein